MMLFERPALERRVLAALGASPPRVPVLVGGCGCGRTSLLLRLRAIIGHTGSQYISVERVATTPERLLQAVVRDSPFPTAAAHGLESTTTTREAFERLLRFLSTPPEEPGTAVTFLLDEVLELRTFESFPGLRRVLAELLDTLSSSRNRFVLSTRFVARAHRWLRDAPPPFEIVHIPPLTPAEVRPALRPQLRRLDEREADDLARAVHALTDGRPIYIRAVIKMMELMDQPGGGDPVSALAALLAPGGHLASVCRFSYELRLHRARGYGALKAILDVLAEEEALTLSEIAHRLRRTPGSTKDYLSWLEDVDLVTVQHKRYSYSDPMLRLWVRLHTRSTPPGDDSLAREVQNFALARLPHAEPALALAGIEAAPGDARGRSWGIIEID